jgi:hypothetical protein
MTQTRVVREISEFQMLRNGIPAHPYFLTLGMAWQGFSNG